MFLTAAPANLVNFIKPRTCSCWVFLGEAFPATVAFFSQMGAGTVARQVPNVEAGFAAGLLSGAQSVTPAGTSAWAVSLFSVPCGASGYYNRLLELT